MAYFWVVVESTSYLRFFKTITVNIRQVTIDVSLSNEVRKQKDEILIRAVFDMKYTPESTETPQ